MLRPVSLPGGSVAIQSLTLFTAKPLRREHDLSDIRSALNEAVRVGRALEGERARDDRYQTACVELADQHLHQPREPAVALARPDTNRDERGCLRS